MDKIKQFIEENEYSIALMEKVNFRYPNEYLNIVTLFANKKNVGYIIFGVNGGTNRIVGIKKVMKSYQEISKNIKKYIKPNIEPIIKIVHVEERNIILVKIVPRKEKSYNCVLKAK